MYIDILYYNKILPALNEKTKNEASNTRPWFEKLEKVSFKVLISTTSPMKSVLQEFMNISDSFLIISLTEQLNNEKFIIRFQLENFPNDLFTSLAKIFFSNLAILVK